MFSSPLDYSSLRRVPFAMFSLAVSVPVVTEGAIAEGNGAPGLVEMASRILAPSQCLMLLPSLLAVGIPSERWVLAVVRKNVVYVQGVFSNFCGSTGTLLAVGILAILSAAQPLTDHLFCI